MLRCRYCWKDVVFLPSMISDLLLIFPLVSDLSVEKHNRETTTSLNIAAFLCFSNSHSSLISETNNSSPVLNVVSRHIQEKDSRIPQPKHISFHVSRVNGQVVPNHPTKWMIKQRTVFCDAMNSCLAEADKIDYLYCLTSVQNSDRYIGCEIKVLTPERQGVTSSC